MSAHVRALIVLAAAAIEPRLGAAREQWRAAADRDPRVRYGGALAAGVILGRVVNRLGR